MTVSMSVIMKTGREEEKLKDTMDNRCMDKGREGAEMNLYR